jgi:RimJ/RimL family protein N-acetyltransferase
LILESIIKAKTSACVYVDELEQPKAAFLWKKDKTWLLGSFNDNYIEDLSTILKNLYLHFLQKHGYESFRLHFDDKCESDLDKILQGFRNEEYLRSYYYIDAKQKKWDFNLPPKFIITEIDENFLTSNYENIDRVREETLSERDSIEDFLENSFGYAVIKGDEIVSWCMSEYNTKDSCELGIETIQKYQRRGLATQVAKVVIRHAIKHGVSNIGWHCWKSNLPSVRTAMSIGFIHGLDYSIKEINLKT